MEKTRSMNLLPSLGFTVLLSLVGVFIPARDVQAQPGNYYYRHDRNIDKSGWFMLNLRGGPAVGLVNTDAPLAFLGSVGMDVGFAVSRDYNAYIVLTPNIQAANDFFHFLIPVGFQYDIRLLRGLYIYPRMSLGFSSMVFTSSVHYGPFHYYSSSTTLGGTFIPEFGIKYIINGRLNLGLEPLSTPVFFNQEGFSVWYRFMFYIGFNA